MYSLRGLLEEEKVNNGSLPSLSSLLSKEVRLFL